MPVEMWQVRNEVRRSVDEAMKELKLHAFQSGPRIEINLVREVNPGEFQLLDQVTLHTTGDTTIGVLKK